MTKRIVSLTLSLIMVLSLFTGLSFPAGAEEEAAGTYVKVTDTGEIADGIEVVIVSERNGVGVEFAEDPLGETEGTPYGACPFVLEDTGSGSFALKHNSQYLHYNDDDGFTLEDSKTTNGMWFISIDEGDVSITQAITGKII